MCQRCLRYTCSVYSGVVTAISLFSVLAVSAANLPHAYVRGFGITVERAGNIASLGALASMIAGCVLCAAFAWLKVGPRSRLERNTLIAFLVFVLVVLLFPSIAES
jgi:hypothetical protein